MSIFQKIFTDKCDLTYLFSKISVLLRCVTLNIYKDTKRPLFCMYLVTYSAVLAYSYVYIFSMYWFVFVHCRETGDLVAASVIFSLGTNSAPCVTKFFFMNFYRNAICELVSRYLECDAKVVPGSRFQINLLKHLKVVKRRAISIWVSLVGIAYMYATRALIRPGRHFPEDLYIVYGLEPPFETPNYEISLILMVMSIIVGVYQLSNVKAFVIILIGYIESQLLALSEELLWIWEDTQKVWEHRNNKEELNNIQENNNIKEIMNEQIKLKLKYILQFHVTIINILNDFDKLYRLISFADYTLVISAIISELLGKIENTFIEIPYTFIQIYIDCYIGQKLSDANDVFTNAIYDCKWDNFDANNKKMVLLLLQNSQKNLYITAGGISPLNYVTLMSMMKTTYSAYTTLQSSVS